MKKENTSIRLKKIMEERKLRQIDILNLTIPYCQKYDVKMNKSDISQYCSGKTEPNQDKLYVLGAALKVNEAWLMGYDVPMERTERGNMKEGPQKIMQYYEQLNDAGKGVATDRVKELTEIPRYTKEEVPDYLKPRAAHNDNQSEDQLAKMREDMAKLKRPE